MTNQLSAHEVGLDNQAFTRPARPIDAAQHKKFRSAKRALSLAFGGRMTGRRIVDLGCLGGGYTAEFARLGFDALGIEIRQTNFENCLAVKNAVDLPNLHFVRDNVWNVANYGEFDAVFCCGILYHLDRPREFLRLVSGQCRRIILVQTHFSTLAPIEDSPALLKFNLSPMSENEGLPGRWYPEHNLDHLAESEALEKMSWTSWENNRSFWIQREYLIEAIHENGFDMVFEQYDCLDSPISHTMTQGFYKTHNRCMFVGIRTEA
jgi:SAM-dependent methyltransferase